MRRTAILIAALTGVLFAPHAPSQEIGESYFGVGYGVVWSDSASPYPQTLDDGTAAGGKIYGGSMGDRFGIELGLYSLGKFDVNLLGAKLAETATTAVAVSGVMATPLGGGYSFHAKLGLAFTQAEFTCSGAQCATLSPVGVNTKKRGTSGLLGLGIGARLGQNVIMRVDFEHFGNVHHQIGTFAYNDGYDIFSVSAQFNF